MFSRKKKTAPPRRKERVDSSLPFGIGIPGFQPNQEENDSDLEAELFALTGEKSNNDISIEDDGGDDDLEAELARIIGTKGKNVNNIAKKESNNVLATVSFDGSDEDSDNVDENDPELLNELKFLTDVVPEEENDNSVNIESAEEVKVTVSQVDLIKNRLALYRDAESASRAKKDLARARRFSRGIKTLEQLLKKAQSGVFVPYNEIPPEIATNLKPDEPNVEPGTSSRIDQTSIGKHEIEVDIQPVSDSVPENILSVNDSEPDDISKSMMITNEESEDSSKNLPESKPQEQKSLDVIEDCTNLPDDGDPLLTLLISRKDEFRKLALSAKKSGNIPLALSNMREVKTCEKLITMHTAGNVINESEIPQLPIDAKNPVKNDSQIQNSSLSGGPLLSGEVFTMPKTVQEALNQRLNYYINAMKKAESMGQRNDLRKIENIVKIYQNAIKLHNKGGNVPFQKLPTPPGCPPIPLTFQMT